MGAAPGDLRLVSGTKLLAQEWTEDSWIWERMIPKNSLTAISAFMKTGKSALVYPLGVAIATGAPFLGLNTVKTKVLFLAPEMRGVDVANLLNESGCSEEAAENILIHSGYLAYSQKSLEQLRAAIIEEQIGLIVVDTLSTWWSIQDETDNAEIVRRIEPILRISREHCTVLLVLHERKASGEYGKEIRGGSALFSLLDQVIRLKRVKGRDNHRILSIIGRYKDSPPELLTHWDNGEWKLVEEIPKRELSYAEKRLFNVLGEANGPLLEKDVAESVRISESYLKSLMAKHASILRLYDRTNRRKPSTLCLSDNYKKWYGKETGLYVTEDFFNGGF